MEVVDGKAEIVVDEEHGADESVTVSVFVTVDVMIEASISTRPGLGISTPSLASQVAGAAMISSDDLARFSWFRHIERDVK